MIPEEWLPDDERWNALWSCDIDVNDFVREAALKAARTALEWASIRAVEVHDEVRFVREDRGDVGDEANEIIDIIRAKLAELESER